MSRPFRPNLYVLAVRGVFQYFRIRCAIRSRVDEIARVSGVLLFLAYPWGLLVGVAHFIKESKKQSWKPSRTCALLLAPYLHLAIFFAPMSIIWK